jgi:hypothetical protein
MCAPDKSLLACRSMVSVAASRGADGTIPPLGHGDKRKRLGACARPANLSLLAEACNHPNLLVLPFSLKLIRPAARH